MYQSSIPARNPKTTSDPAISILLDENGWLASLPFSEKSRYDIPPSFLPFIHPKDIMRILLEWDCKRMRMPDDNERISYSEMPGHEALDFINLLVRTEKNRYIDSKGGITRTFFGAMDKTNPTDLALIRLATYHKQSVEKVPLREELQQDTVEVEVTGIPYENARAAIPRIKELLKGFGKIKTIVWKQIVSSNYNHQGWAVFFIDKTDSPEFVRALENKEITMLDERGRTWTLNHYIPKYPKKNASANGADSKSSM